MKKSLRKIRWALCQMKVVPGDSRANADNLISEMAKAAERKRQILVAPEMSIPGYLIGDTWEDKAFISDMMYHNDRIREASKKYGIVVIFGSGLPDFSKKNEKGLFRLANCAFIAQNGQWVDIISKTLFPNYRYFDDARNFFSSRQEVSEYNEIIAGREAVEAWREQLKVCSDVLRTVEIKIGKIEINLGVILCEDMWKGDYPVNPALILSEQGADLIINLSASPWGWQKNRKRHSEVEVLFEGKKRKALIYVNNVGPQNNGKNILAFDGSSTVYDEDGKIVFMIPPYEAGTRDFSFADAQEINYSEASDVVQMRLAIESAIGDFFADVPKENRNVHIGLSGGVDSAVSAAIHINVLGKENVYLYYMPMEMLSSDDSEKLAQQFADNFGMNLEIIPIKESVEALAKASGTEKGTGAYGSLQAKVRGMILSAKARQYGGFFPANFNKVEAAFGYGTLYGDIAGYMAPLGDLVKREIRQLGFHYNEEVFCAEMIPTQILKRRPTAELEEGQFDPFDYGDLERRGYHDEMVRAFTEFRKNPEWFLERYYEGTLEKDLLLEAGTLRRLFPKVSDFIADLKLNWQLFYGNVFKRVQSPPIVVISRRAFGYDLREFIGARPMTERSWNLERKIFDKYDKKSRIYVLGSSLNPTCRHHQEIVEFSIEKFGLVIVRPCWLRPDKESVNSIEPRHRAEIAKIAFGDMPGAFLDLGDFEKGHYTPTYLLDLEYRQRFSGSEIWHIIGTDILSRDENGVAELDTWDFGPQLRETLNFIVLDRGGHEVPDEDLPVNSIRVPIREIFGSGTYVRDMIRKGEDTSLYLDEAIRKYIDDNGLYR